MNEQPTRSNLIVFVW